MFMRAFVYRFVYVGVLGLGIALSAAFQQPVAQAAAMRASPKQAAAVAPAPVPIVTLSTVHVTADAVRAPVAKSSAPVRVDTTSSAGDVATNVAPDRHSGGGLAPTLRLDMPYYSFGKMLPRVGKE